MASNRDDASRIRVAREISDPPVLSAADLTRIRQESARLYAAFTERTASMEVLTADDLGVLCGKHHSGSRRGI